MDLQEWIDYANSKCALGARMLSFGSDVWTRDLTDDEAELLAAAAVGDGCIRLAAGTAFPEIHVSESKEHFSDLDCMAQWYGFISLCERGVIAPDYSGFFVLKETGVIKGRRIATGRLTDRNGASGAV